MWAVQIPNGLLSTLLVGGGDGFVVSVKNCGGKVLPTSGFGGIGVWRVDVRATLDTSSR